MSHTEIVQAVIGSQTVSTALNKCEIDSIKRAENLATYQDTSMIDMMMIMNQLLKKLTTKKLNWILLLVG